MALISLQDFEEALTKLEEKSITYHHNRGLPTNLDPESVISIVYGKNPHQNSNLKYWKFELKKDNKKLVNFNKI